MPVVGLETIDEDLKLIKNQINVALNGTALDFVEGELKTILIQHINDDVYSAYKPSEYKRRSKDESLGRPLNAERNMGLVHLPSGFYFWYEPIGEHKVSRWDTADGDSLIGRIERKSPSYTFDSPRIKQRPFWQNFVADTLSGGALFNAFAAGMSMAGFVLEDDGAGITFDSSDGSY